MNNRIELPLIEPIYSTYHNAPASAAAVNNPSIKNWFLNEIMMLTCNRIFLEGFTSPQINVLHSGIEDNPYFIKQNIDLKYIWGHIHSIMKRLIEDGYYIWFSGVDDYYVKGKSWYKERHFNHDACVCGYDNDNKTYCIYSYDKNWIYRKFWTTQKSFDNGMRAIFNQGYCGFIVGFKAKDTPVEFLPEVACRNIAEYLDPPQEKYDNDNGDSVYGIIVHDYIAQYVGKLYDGSIPYERMDRRVFRMIWEHKKAMLQRIILIEKAFSLDSSISETYKTVVQEADNCRMLYAAHHMKERRSVLPIIQKKLLTLKENEQKLLEKLLTNVKGDKTK